jgi:protein-tyrosine-phosphatase
MSLPVPGCQAREPLVLHDRFSVETFVRRIRVLFLCWDNRVQSPMAEGLLNRFDSVHFEAMSAGIERGETHPLTVKAMREIGIDLERRIPKSIDD